MKQHEWIPSKLGHGEQQCRWCHMTNREAMVLVTECRSAPVNENDAEIARLRAELAALRAEAKAVVGGLVERIELNGGLGEYKGGKPFIIADARALLAKLGE